MDFCVVVEVDEHITQLIVDLTSPNQPRIVRLCPFASVADPLGPPIERRVSVTADVKLLRTVQANVNEIGG